MARPVADTDSERRQPLYPRISAARCPMSAGGPARILPIFLLLNLLVLAGCGGEEQAPPPSPVPIQAVPTFTVTAEAPAVSQPISTPIQETPAATATETAVPVATDTPLPTLTPTATPSPLPSAQLAEGIRLHRIGDYAAARRLFGALLDQSQGAPGVRAEAAFFLAKAYLLDGNAQEALAGLDRFTQIADEAGLDAEHEYRQDALFLRGDALALAGQPAEALVAYQQFLTRRPDLAEVAQAQIARSHVALGNTADAAAAYLAAAEASHDRVRQVLLLESLATLYMDRGMGGDAAAVYERILANSVNPPYRAEILYRAGQALAVAGDTAGAIARWQAATGEKADSRYAYLALIELVNRQVDFDLIERGIIDIHAQAWTPALSAFQLFMQQAPAEDPRMGVALHGLGQAQLGLENATAAIDLFRRVLEEFPDCTCIGQTWLDLARAYLAAGNGTEARRTYRTFARAHPEDPLAAEGLWRSALSAMREGNQLEMAADFLFLADGFPNHARAPEALYVVGIGAVLEGFYSQAIDLLSRLQADYPEHRSAAATYWLGRSHLARGEREEATAQWRRLTAQEPDTYYGILAAQALNRPDRVGQDLLVHAGQTTGPASSLEGDDGSLEFAEGWLASWISSQTGPYALLPAAVAADPDLKIGRSLLAVERRGEAVTVLDDLRLRYQDDPHALFALMLEFEQMGAYRHSLLAARRLVDLSPARLIQDAPIFIQQRIYPRPFIQLITLQAQAHGIDPLVLFSLVRQESLFEEGARSFAAAQGLAQIIPDTAAWIAQQLQYPDFYNDLVYRPHINIRFGAYYLSWVRDYMDGNLVSALVGYNAGPGNSRFWRDISGPDDTLFVETLTVNEPRIYVQQIVSNVYHYSRLYGP